jgi:hypothetical protein
LDAETDMENNNDMQRFRGDFSILDCGKLTAETKRGNI